VLASVAIGSDNCPSSGCFGPSGTDISLALIFLLGLPLYVIGLLAMWMWDQSGHSPKPKVSRPPQSHVRSGPPGRKQGW